MRHTKSIFISLIAILSSAIISAQGHVHEYDMDDPSTWDNNGKVGATISYKIIAERKTDGPNHHEELNYSYIIKQVDSSAQYKCKTCGKGMPFTTKMSSEHKILSESSSHTGSPCPELIIENKIVNRLFHAKASEIGLYMKRMDEEINATLKNKSLCGHKDKDDDGGEETNPSENVWEITDSYDDDEWKETISDDEEHCPCWCHQGATKYGRIGEQNGNCCTHNN